MCGGQALWTGQDCHRVCVTVLSYVWRSSFVDWTGLPQSLCDCAVLCVAVKLCDWTGLPQNLCDCAVLCVAVKLCGLDRIAT